MIKKMSMWTSQQKVRFIRLLLFLFLFVLCRGWDSAGSWSGILKRSTFFAELLLLRIKLRVVLIETTDVVWVLLTLPLTERGPLLFDVGIAFRT